MSNNPICNTVFDSRDLIEYYDELKEQILYSYNEHKREQDEDWEDIDDIDLIDDEYKVNNEEIEEYERLTNFIDELEASPDFKYGESIIHEDYWKDFCIEELEQLGYIPKDFPSWIEIDYDATSENMAQDYTQVEYEGDNYYIRL